LAGQLREHPGGRDRVNEAFIENIFRASPLHDIGKVAIRDSILLKPGSLTPAEFDEMKSHTTLGAQTLQEVQKAYPKNGFVRMGIEIARSHHERWDGTGYPNGLAGTAIPLSARIMAVADSYDAARSRRFYKPPLPHAECCAAIYRRSGTYLDPVVVEAFRAVEDRFCGVAESLGE
jgi:putative two-component system response regulator